MEGLSNRLDLIITTTVDAKSSKTRQGLSEQGRIAGGQEGRRQGRRRVTSGGELMCISRSAARQNEDAIGDLRRQLRLAERGINH
jgi:hypothetical protein